MANGDQMMSWERWEKLDPEVQDWERYRFLASLDKRVSALEGGKWKRTISQLAASFAGGIAFWVGVVLFFKKLLPICGEG